jgi:Uncharacterised nucleotidyltransferase
MAALRSLASVPVEPQVALERTRPRALDIGPTLEHLADRAGSIDDLRLHKLQLVAAHGWRERGGLVPRPLVDEERYARMLALLAPIVLRRVREAVQGRIVLIKGPEAAERYPDPTLRPYGDLDLLVEDAPRVQRALLAAGFVEVGDVEPYVDIHHLRPLAWPGLPLPIEIHERPKWIVGVDPPSTSELLAAAVPSATGIAGIDALPPAHHALVLAAHAWAHTPLQRVLELADVALVADEADRDEIRALAGRWGVARLWRTTEASADALFRGSRRPLALHVWARNLSRVDDRTVLESHLQRWLSPFGALPRRYALAAALRRLGRDLRPRRGETWRTKAVRTFHALVSPFTRLSDHHRALDRSERAREGDRP